MDRGEIWEIDLDPTLGSEQRGRRPVLVVTLKEFNQKAKIAFVCPITGGGNLARFEGFAVSLISSGTRTDGVVLCHQLRAVDWKARRPKKIEKAPDFISEEVLDCLADMIA